MIFKGLVPLLALCLIGWSQGKPTADYFSEGRGIGSTLWGWITYPFSWWGSGDIELPPINDQLIGSPYTPYDNIEIVKRNVTVWCNDQTCTTMKCDKLGCKNITCNIYDTDLKGECREYNTDLKPEEPVPSKPPMEVASPTSEVTESTQATPATSVSTVGSTTTVTNQPIEEHPLELEAIISSTVTEGRPAIESSDAKGKKSSSPINKI